MRYTVLALWVLIIGASVWIVSRTPISNELTVFLPEQDQSTELLSQLRDGPASRLLLLAVTGGTPEQLARASRQMAEQLRASGLFLHISNGAQSQNKRLFEWLFQQRYLLSPTISPERFSEQSLRQALQARLRELSSPLAMFSKRLLPADPTGEINTLLAIWRDTAFAQNQLMQQHGVWFSDDGQRALLLAHTHASGFDLAGQSTVIDSIEKAFKAVQTDDGMALIISGTGAFGVQAQTLIRAETKRASALASALLVLLLLLCLRSLRLVLLGALPLLTGVVVAAAAVGFFFGKLHAITLAFGVTLLGVAIDYPIHFFGHLSRRQTPLATIRQLWPTLRLGLTTTLIAYLAMASASQGGLAQLGVFASAGLLAAALCTRYGLPALLPAHWQANVPVPRRLGVLLKLPRSVVGGSMILLIALLLRTAPSEIWEDDLAALSPVPASAIALDRELRTALGAPEAGQLILVSAPHVETVLQDSEQIVALMPEWIAQGYLNGYEAAVRYLPSQRKQAERQEALPAPEELRTRLAAALAGLPFQPDLFEPFLQAVETARNSPLISFEVFRQTDLAARLTPLLSQDKQQRWLALLPLVGVQDAEPLQTALNALALPNTRYVDLRAETNRLMADFRQAALSRCLLGVVLMSVLLRLVLRAWRRTFAVLAPVMLAVLLTLGLLLALGQQLSLFHLVALLLVLGLGLDYAIFFNREERDLEERARTLYAILVCAGSTLAVFGIIASSQLPVLRALGLTIVLGTCASFVLTLFIARPHRSPEIPN